MRFGLLCGLWCVLVMSRKRLSSRSLALTRIYIKGRRFYYFSALPMLNPKTGKLAKWHSLCSVDDGELKARELAQSIAGGDFSVTGRGDFPSWISKYADSVLQVREAKRPRDAARLQLFKSRNKEIRRTCEFIALAFADFNVSQVLPVDVAQFVDQWAGRRAASYYLSRLSSFMSWAARRGLRADNPCRDVSVEKPVSRPRYLTHAEFVAVRNALAVGLDGRQNSSGAMLQCYVDLCYLLYQRTTEIRLLRWSDVEKSHIHFKPTKTESSSGASVDVPVTAQIQAVLDRARSIGRIRSVYVIHNLRGSVYTASGLRTAWARACIRAGVVDATLKDIRAKALTDAKKAGFSIQQIQTGAVHTDEKQTGQYIKRRQVPVSEVVLTLPECGELEE